MREGVFSKLGSQPWRHVLAAGSRSMASTSTSRPRLRVPDQDQGCTTNSKTTTKFKTMIRPRLSDTNTDTINFTTKTKTKTEILGYGTNTRPIPRICKLNLETSQVRDASLRQIFRIGTVRYAEGLWRMRRHGPVIAHCTDSEDFPSLMNSSLQSWQ